MPQVVPVRALLRFAGPRALKRIARVAGSRCFFWLVLALPAVVQSYRYWQESIYYGEYLHWTGQVGAQLLIATMAVTPLRLTFPTAGWSRWLASRRRYLGVATFAYSALHAIAYLERAGAAGEVVDDALGIAIGSGWIALVVFLVLAGTSNDASMRKLRRNWKVLHRSIYIAAMLTFAHWILTAFDPTVGFIHLAVLVSLEAWRLWKRRQRGPVKAATSPDPASGSRSISDAASRNAPEP